MQITYCLLTHIKKMLTKLLKENLTYDYSGEKKLKKMGKT